MHYDERLGRIFNELRQTSRGVFGKTYRLEIVALVAAQEPPVWPRRVARSLGIAENVVAGELKNYAKLGALQRFPAAHDRRKIYQLVPHPLWGFGRELAERVIARTAEEEEELLPLFWESLLGSTQPQPIPEASP
jgi:hypothetical protein